MKIKKAAVKPVLVGIVGASASGKTTMARKISKKLGKSKTVIISQDQYYKDWSKVPLKRRQTINFDHPDSFDFSLMHSHIKELKRGKPVKAPLYSYKLHKRLRKKTKISPKRWVIVEGLLVFYKGFLRDLFDMKVYIDVDTATSLARRIRRDVKERGESVSSVSSRFFKDVLPMQKEYIEKQRQYAGIVVNSLSTDDEGLLDRLTQILDARSAARHKTE
ncbi:MAG: uridine kinase [Candidatus Omnitrophica bacterium]|nr:uridine kinase [Candidatus Omnitrophota bacterium]